MLTAYLLGGSIAALVIAVFVVAFLLFKARSVQQRKALEPILERYQSGQALVRYVMLNRQCPEEVAYQRLETFVINHAPLDDLSSIERRLANDRQCLVEMAQSILVHDSAEIDKI